MKNIEILLWIAFPNWNNQIALYFTFFAPQTISQKLSFLYVACSKIILKCPKGDHSKSDLKEESISESNAFYKMIFRTCLVNSCMSLWIYFVSIFYVGFCPILLQIAGTDTSLLINYYLLFVWYRRHWKKMSWVEYYNIVVEKIILEVWTHYLFKGSYRWFYTYLNL